MTQVEGLATELTAARGEVHAAVERSRAQLASKDESLQVCAVMCSLNAACVNETDVRQMYMQLRHRSSTRELIYTPLSHLQVLQRMLANLQTIRLPIVQTTGPAATPHNGEGAAGQPGESSSNLLEALQQVETACGRRQVSERRGEG